VKPSETTASKLIHGIDRRSFVVIISLTMALAALAIDITLPAFATMRGDFGLAEGSSAVAPVITASLAGLAIGQVAWGPLSDSLGRKVILYAGITVYVAGAIGSALTPSLTVLYLTSFITGLGASGARVVALSSVRDTYSAQAMAKMMSYVMMVFLLVPLIAPTLGATILAFSGWRAIYAFIAVAGITVLLVNRQLPETLQPQDRLPLHLGNLGRAGWFVVTNRLTMGYTLAQTAVFGFFASYLASSELVINDVFGMGRWFTLVFSGFAALLAVAVFLNNMLLNLLNLRTMLRIAFGGFTVVALAFAAMALVTDGVPPFGVFVAMLAPLLLVHGLLLPNLNAAALIPMGSVAGTASAIIGLISILGGSIIGSFIDRAFNGTILPLALSAAVLGLISLGFAMWADRVWDEATKADVQTA
jgi:DHA1 family bicyclomycin/chloramphenicol resistance-like MFS transporter